MAHLRLSDRGSILPLLMGLVALLMALLGGLSALAEISHAQRWLHQIADEAVVAATSAIDTDRYYREGAVGEVPLSVAEARRRVAASLSGHPVRVEEIRITGDEVLLRLSCPVDVAWGWKRLIVVEVAAKPH